MRRYFVEEVKYECNSIPGRIKGVYISRSLPEGVDSLETSSSITQILARVPTADFTQKIVVFDD